ncbi:YHYH protein [Reichenbachiella agarivorans]|uniref:YHYH protein n=1 Tax=Reichenbachiella agarivorans TaxID=2979464 RepID=A0ABY6CL44_9BACT|nr:YHYH protein [Reichenbachiella agarivorans]UXP31239.1 YHYH protein [Reichenbachiella agarivorans]
MKNKQIVIKTIPLLILLFLSYSFIACQNDDIHANDDSDENTVTELHAAFAEFDTNETDIYIDGTQIVIETTGRPNHSSVYWGKTNALYKEEPTVSLTPSLIPNYNADATLRVSANPQLASQSTSTSLGAIGIAVSGAAIFNDQEGNGALNEAASSLDYSGGHIGPAEYHYHLEPAAWSYDDDVLIGIIADGFFIYGRKCHATETYPTDLDESGGHTSVTQHTDVAEYHYHIKNELYLNQYYILFPGEYMGTPNAIN